MAKSLRELDYITLGLSVNGEQDQSVEVQMVEARRYVHFSSILIYHLPSLFNKHFSCRLLSSISIFGDDSCGFYQSSLLPTCCNLLFVIENISEQHIIL